jgi:outer membrane protein assembly factor BamB
MSIPSRRGFLLVLPLGLLALAVALCTGQTRDIDDQLPPPPPNPSFGGLSALPIDRKARQKIEAASDYIQAKSWPEVVSLLQPILDGAEDVLIPDPTQKTGPDEEVSHWVSLHAEAERLVAGLPPAARTFYQTKVGGKAAELLKTARANNDPRLLAEVVRRYEFTEAGALALDGLGTYHLDRDRPGLAAAYYEHWLARTSAPRDARSLFRAALAFHRGGNPKLAEQVWKQLTTAAPDGLRFGERMVSLEQLRQELDRLPASELLVGDWPVFRGNASRSARGRGELPLLEPSWRQTTCEPFTRQWLEGKAKLLESMHLHRLQGAFPLVVQGKVVVKGQSGLIAVDARTGQMLWKATSPLDLDVLLRQRSSGTLDTLYAQHIAEGPALQEGAGADAFRYYQYGLCRVNSVTGALSSDGSRVFAIDDLPVHPTQSLVRAAAQDALRLPVPYNTAVRQNHLRAFDVFNGRLLWETGGAGKSELQDVLFLGPPLPWTGCLYGLLEKQGQVRLYCLDALSGQAVWTQALTSTAVASEGYLTDLLSNIRRVQATHCALGDGLLICPSDSGVLFGIDLISRRIAWAHAYTDPTAKPREDRRPSSLSTSGAWQAAPIIADGKVVFTPVDAHLIGCLNLRDGSVVWQTERGDDDLYVAGVFNSKVLLVGASSCRALSLADGKPVWQRATGLPSGMGVAGGNAYYLPLQKGAILVLDLDTGNVLASCPARDGTVPGNLVFCEGLLISQTATVVTAYPPLKDRIAQLDAVLGRTADDLAALTERATLRLEQKQIPLALTDLCRALDDRRSAEESPGERIKLYETINTLLHGALTPEQRREIVQKLGQEGQSLRDSEQVVLLKSFETLFGSHVPEAAEVSLRLADQLVRQQRWLEAEQLLLDVRDDLRLAPQAVEALARLYARLDLPDDALACYRELDSARAAELSTDKRFLTYFTATPERNRGAFQVEEKPGRLPWPRRVLVFIPEGSPAPFFARHQLSLDLDHSRLELVDTTTGLEIWRQGLELGDTLRCLALLQSSPQRVQLTYRVRGHLALVQVGPSLYAFDFLERRLLWKREPDVPRTLVVNTITFITDQSNLVVANNQVTAWFVYGEPNPLGHALTFPGTNRVEVSYADGRSRRLGVVGPIRSHGICVRVDNKLIGLDPFHGTPNWTRDSVSDKVDVFGDTEAVYFVDEEKALRGQTAVEATCAISVRDGVEVTVPRFTEADLEARHKRVVGPYLLVTEPPGLSTLRLYDVRGGTDVWKANIPLCSLWVEGPDATHAAVMTKEGKVLVFDLRTRRQVLSADIDAQDLNASRSYYLLRDDRRYYLVCNYELTAQNENDSVAPGWSPRLVAGRAHGTIYAFDRVTGEKRWKAELEPNYLVFDRFEKMPFFIFGTLHQEQGTSYLHVWCLDKESGKVVCDRKIANGQVLEAIVGDPRMGAVELIGAKRSLRLTH